MGLAPGTRIGSYEIVSMLGAGGMGEVYKARDTKLQRDVALKILPELFASDPDRVARFQREARTLGALNHPHIAAIHGFEDSNGTRALVLEFVDGETLADRIARGPLPLDEALPVARQIAEALEAAHGQGIIHRDLKPANIKVRADGTVKVLDFGLAKAMAGDSSPAVVATSPTMTSPAATSMGTIMGTAAYMSPEQARGRAVDKRSDIWSYGVVVYEMLTGRRAFDGEDVSDTLVNILKADLDWSMLPPGTSPSIARALRRCLVRDPRLRTHDIADVRIELDEREAHEPAGVRLPATAGSGRVGRLERVIWIGIALTLATVAGLFYRARATTPPAPVAVRFHVRAPADHSLGMLSGLGSGLGAIGALSPDGTRLVFYATDRSGNSALWLRALDSFDARKLAETESASQPFWSPDGKFIGYFANRRLYKTDAARGEPREICAVQGIPRGASWGSAGVIIFSTTNPQALMRVSADGGRPSEIRLSGTDGIGPASWPAFLPDGRHFLYWIRIKVEPGTAINIASIDLESKSERLTASETQAVYVAPGYLLFGRDTRLVRQAFDADRRQLSGDAVPIVDRLRSILAVGYGEFATSNGGVLAYRSGLDTSNQFAWVDRSGKLERTVGPPGHYRTPAVSPDGRRLVYTDNADQNLKILDLERRQIAVLTSDPGSENAPVWSPDGTHVYYRSDSGGVFMKEANGTTPVVKIFDGNVNGPSQVVHHPTLGTSLLFFGALQNQPSLDLLVMPLKGEPVPQVLLSSPFAEVEPQVSPDGKWLAYVSNESGRNEVYVQPFPPDGKTRWQVSTAGGRQPLWRADSRELFFVGDDRRFYALSIPEHPESFDAEPQFLFEMRSNVYNTRNSYVPSRDGRRFLVNLLLDTADAPISVVSNWLADAK